MEVLKTEDNNLSKVRNFGSKTICDYLNINERLLFLSLNRVFKTGCTHSIKSDLNNLQYSWVVKHKASKIGEIAEKLKINEIKICFTTIGSKEGKNLLLQL